jgi:hypothetical protein
MAENYEGASGIMNKLALIADAIQTMYPEGKGVVVLALNQKDFKDTQISLLIPQQDEKQYKVDISGTEFIFLPDELLNDETSNS